MSLCINPVCSQPHQLNQEKQKFCQSCGSQLELLGKYRVMRLLGKETGFSTVYEVYEQDTAKILKVLNENLSGDPKLVELFQKQLNDSDIAKDDGYFQYQTRNGSILHCFVTEKIDGINLEEFSKQQSNPSISPEQTEELFLSTSKTLLPHEKPPENMPLLRLLAALITSLGLLGLVALFLGNVKFNFIPSYAQAPERKGKVDYFAYVPGKDSQGRIAEFNIAVLSVEYKWLLGSNFQIKHNDTIISLEALKLNLEQDGIQKIMENPNEIISVGTASCEGNVIAEQKRALERSRQIQLLAKKLFNNTPSVKGYRLLNLGQFQRSDCQANQDLTTYQRSVIIIGIKKKSEGVIIDEALRDRLEKKPFADFKLEDYSLGSLGKFKTIPSNINS
jgi:hypothetical protein